MRIKDVEAATTFLREHYEKTSVAAELPECRLLGASHGYYRFAVYWPHNGHRAVVNVGPRGGLITTASFWPGEWKALQEVWT